MDLDLVLEHANELESVRSNYDIDVSKDYLKVQKIVQLIIDKLGY